MNLSLPDFSLVVLIGPSGAGKSTLARKHFLETEIVSSDACRAMVCDDETDQSSTADAFSLLGTIVETRLKRRKLTVIDATSVQKADRAKLIDLAKRHHALPVALVLDMDPALCHARNQQRANRGFGPQTPQRHSKALRKSLRGLQKEGFRQVHVCSSPEEVDALSLERHRLWTDRRDDKGPFDIIGDVHGCFSELTTLLAQLGYVLDPYESGENLLSARHPEGRRAFFVGDLVDRGPRNVDCLRLAMGMCAEGSGEWVLGNHDAKLGRWLKGKAVKPTHGFDLTMAEMENTSQGFRDTARAFIDGGLSHAWLAEGELVIAHAGLKESMHGRASGAVRAFSMFGETTGETDEFGLPIRIDWAREYRGEADVVYGHTPVPRAEWQNKTLCLDTGCVFGGSLTALRWPEKEIVSIPAQEQYSIPLRPLEDEHQKDDHELLYFDDYASKQRIQPETGKPVTIQAENMLAALETTSRFGIDPRWMIYLPPTMAAPPTAQSGPFLEHPEPTIDFFQSLGITDLVAEEKHMGSRALIVVPRDGKAAARRFSSDRRGAVYTRTGRPFFKDQEHEDAVLHSIVEGITSAGLWEELKTDWLLLDAEIMPWSLKAQELLVAQFQPTAIAAAASAGALLDALSKRPDLTELEDLRARKTLEKANAETMSRVIDGYCWDVASPEDIRIAPFHILAGEGSVFNNKPHVWHMEMLQKVCAAGGMLHMTGWRPFNAESPIDRADVLSWWLAHTQAGGEGLVIKPNAFTLETAKGLVQPAMKVRGRDYLRLIYGPDYDSPENLSLLRERSLHRKLSMAEREFRLGMEGLRRFVEGASLSEVHRCALAVLALESEPVDPRL